MFLAYSSLLVHKVLRAYKVCSYLEKMPYVAFIYPFTTYCTPFYTLSNDYVKLFLLKKCLDTYETTNIK